MWFVLVNGRAPRRASTCAHCGKPIATGYLRDLTSQLAYCDRACFVGGSKTTTPSARFGADIDSLPFGSSYGHANSWLS
jgi:hypothetical protein